MKATKVTLWRWNRSTGCWHAAGGHLCHSIGHATRWALAHLGEARLTRYQSTARTDFACVSRTGKRKPLVIEQPITTVLSVGEVGYW
jgi:hypothetical protein